MELIYENYENDSRPLSRGHPPHSPPFSPREHARSARLCSARALQPHAEPAQEHSSWVGHRQRLAPDRIRAGRAGRSGFDLRRHGQIARRLWRSQRLRSRDGDSERRENHRRGGRDLTVVLYWWRFCRRPVQCGRLVGLNFRLRWQSHHADWPARLGRMGGADSSRRKIGGRWSDGALFRRRDPCRSLQHRRFAGRFFRWRRDRRHAYRQPQLGAGSADSAGGRQDRGEHRWRRPSISADWRARLLLR